MDSASIGAAIVAGQVIALSGATDLLAKFFPRGTKEITERAKEANRGLSAIIYPLIRDRFDEGVATLEEQTRRDLERLNNPRVLLILLVLETPQKKKVISIVAGDQVRRVHRDSFWKEKLAEWAPLFKTGYAEGFLHVITEVEKILTRTFLKAK